MDAVRQDEQAFEGLDGFDFPPSYTDSLRGYEGLRMHYLDLGPHDAEHTYVCLHGEPTWCYLYRKMIPVFLAGGSRVVAPDYFGFGRSDKPTKDDVYTFSFHRNSILRLIEALDLQNITLVCQDWGGLVGLTLPMEHPERFKRLLVMNTALATGSAPPSKGFEAWKAYCLSQKDLAVGALMKRSTPSLSQAEVDAYDAPFSGPESKAGVRTFPAIVPVTPEMDGAEISRRAAKWWASSWKGQSFMAIGMQDPVLGPKVMYALRALIPGCPEPMEVAEAGHFVQEYGASIAEAALRAWEEGKGFSPHRGV